jgi:putative ABC transport system permease protein
MVRAFIKSTGGQGVLSIPYGRITIYVIVAACAAALAAVIPARRAARAPIASALMDT